MIFYMIPYLLLYVWMTIEHVSIQLISHPYKQDPNWNIKSQICEMVNSTGTAYVWRSFVWSSGRKNISESLIFHWIKTVLSWSFLQVSLETIHCRTRMVLTSPSGPLTSVQTLEIGHGETFSDGDSTVRHEDLTTKVVLSLRKMWIFPFVMRISPWKMTISPRIMRIWQWKKGT